MPPYKEPTNGSPKILKFIRVRGNIFVGREIEDRHKDIARMDGIVKDIDEIRKTDPTEVDAGFVRLKDEGLILIDQESDSLDLPVVRHFTKAREITIIIFQEQSPSYIVRGEKSRF